MMFMAVDLPEPDGPMMATNSRGLNLEVGAGKRMNGRIARPVDLGDGRELDQGSAAIWSASARHACLTAWPSCYRR